MAGLLVAGCGGKPHYPKTYPVTGKVLVNGRPADRAEVTLHPLEDPDGKAVLPYAVTGSDGTFRLSTYRTHDGAPAGQYLVTVVWPSFAADPLGEEVAGPDRLGGRYGKAGQSGLTATVREGDNELAPFALSVR